MLGSKPEIGANSHHDHRWVVLLIASLGSMLISIQSTALLISFADILKNLDATLPTLLWVLLAYQLVITSIVLSTSKISDALGRIRMFKLGYFLFILASLLSGFAQPSNQGYDLVGYRVLMGIGATLLFNNTIAILADQFAPHGQLALAQGVLWTFFAAGIVLGPVVGGVIGQQDIRWIFWFNVVVGGPAVLGAVVLIKEKPHQPAAPAATNGAGAAAPAPTAWQKLKAIDWLGSFLNIAFFTFFLLAMVQAVLPDPNLSTTTGKGVLSALTIAFLALFVWNSARASNAQPLLPLAIFKNRLFSGTIVSNFFQAFGRNNVTFIMIFFLQGPYGSHPLMAGVQLIPFGLGIMVATSLSGRLTDKFGPRLWWGTGGLLAFAGSLGMAFVDKDTNYWLIAFALLVAGFGYGLENSPISAVSMTSINPVQRTTAAALLILGTLLAAMIGLVMDFALILNAVNAETIIGIFVFGETPAQNQMDDFMRMIQAAWYITAAAAFASCLMTPWVPADFGKAPAKPAAAASKPASPAVQLQTISVTVSAKPADSSAAREVSHSDSSVVVAQNGGVEQPAAVHFHVKQNSTFHLQPPTTTAAAADNQTIAIVVNGPEPVDASSPASPNTQDSSPDSAAASAVAAALASPSDVAATLQPNARTSSQSVN